MGIDGVVPQTQANATTRANRTTTATNVRQNMIEQFGKEISKAQTRAIESGHYSTSAQIWADHEPNIAQTERVEIFMEVLAELRDTLQGPEYNLGCEIVWPRNGCGGTLGCDVKLDWSSNPTKSSGPIPPYEYKEIIL